MAPTSGVGVNEGHFTLITTVSSYVNPKLVHGVRLWDKCYCLMLESGPCNHPKGGGGRVFVSVFYVVEDTLYGFYDGGGLNWFGHVCGFRVQG